MLSSGRRSCDAEARDKVLCNTCRGVVDIALLKAPDHHAAAMLQGKVMACSTEATMGDSRRYSLLLLFHRHFKLCYMRNIALDVGGNFDDHRGVCPTTMDCRIQSNLMWRLMLEEFGFVFE